MNLWGVCYICRESNKEAGDVKDLMLRLLCWLLRKTCCSYFPVRQPKCVCLSVNILTCFSSKKISAAAKLAFCKDTLRFNRGNSHLISASHLYCIVLFSFILFCFTFFLYASVELAYNYTMFLARNTVRCAVCSELGEESAGGQKAF